MRYVTVAIIILSLSYCPLVCQSAAVRSMEMSRRPAEKHCECCCDEAGGQSPSPPLGDCGRAGPDCICHGATLALKSVESGGMTLGTPIAPSLDVLPPERAAAPLAAAVNPFDPFARPPTDGHRLRIVLGSLLI
jgi:hypothetical protein